MKKKKKVTTAAKYNGLPITMGGHNYTVNHKKRDILFLTITLANLNLFS